MFEYVLKNKRNVCGYYLVLTRNYISIILFLCLSRVVTLHVDDQFMRKRMYKDSIFTPLDFCLF